MSKRGEPVSSPGQRTVRGATVNFESKALMERLRETMARLARWIWSAQDAPRETPAKPVLSTEPRRGAEAPGVGAAVVTKTRPKPKRPNMYRVLLLNDDYTPMEFVVGILQAIFNKSLEEATRIMLHVHHTGVGECGVYTYEIAETKVAQVMEHARKNQHPLQCIMEKK